MEMRKTFSELDVAPPDSQLRGQEIQRFSLRRPQRNRPLLVASFIWIICLFTLAPLAQAQQPEHVPLVCVPIQKELEGLKIERSDLQAELKQGVGSQKQGKAGQIMNLLSQITAKQKELTNCAKANGGKPDLNATLTGTATMTTNNPKVAGPFAVKVAIGVLYPRWLHDELLINIFPDIVFGPFDTHSPCGSVTETIGLEHPGVSSVDPKTGSITETVILRFKNDCHLPGSGDSDLLITLSTENAGGSRLNSVGKITLVGDGTFKDGYLGGDSCHLLIKGTLLPLP